MIHSLRVGLVPLYLSLCLLLGGASAAGYWENMALQLIALPILFWSLIVRRGTPMAPAGRQLLTLVLIMVVAVLLQLVPLPPSLWTALPGRAAVAESLALLGQPLRWMPISLAPSRTIASLLWLLPALAVLLGIVRLGTFKSNWIAWAIVIVAGISAPIGALQIAGGAGSPWYFYRITNFGSSTGFFANANHLATLLVLTIPFLAALYLAAKGKGRSTQRASGLLVIVGGALAVVMVGIVINRSLAGIGLMVPAAAASLLMIRSRKTRLPAWSAWAVGLLMVGAVVAVFLAPISNNLTGSGARSDSSSRNVSFTLSSKAALDYLPFGSGTGTFVEIYPTYEDQAKVDRFYMNHVHGDYIELVLETGVVGAILLLLFLSWWVRRTVAIWRAQDPDYFARAATIASAAVLAHSIVDYPLRTVAISAIFAACLALMAEPRPRVRRRETDASPEGKARHLSAD